MSPFFIAFSRVNSNSISVVSVVQRLNDKGIKTRKGNKFAAASIHTILKNETYKGIIKSGKYHSKILEHLQIIDVKTFNEVQDMIQKRSAYFKESRQGSVPLKTTGQGLLSGNVFCGHYGKRLNVTTQKRRHKKKDGTVTEHVNTLYRCNDRALKKTDCDGLTGYNLKKVDKVIDEVIHNLFTKIKDTPKSTMINARYDEQIKQLQGNLNRSKQELQKHEKENKAYRSEVIKAIQGESAFDSEILNSLILESNENLQTATELLQIRYRQGNY